MLIIAHRGASAELPENTLPALNRALEHKADGIEIDVCYVDGDVFIFHDRYLERLTATPGRLLDLTQTQIRALKIFGQHPLPTLKQALELINGRCLLNIELKGEVPLDVLQGELDYAKNHCNFTEQTLLVSSFNHHWLKALKQRCPWVRLGALSASCLLDYAEYASRLNAYSVHACVDFLCPELIDDAHRRGMPVYVYTVDEAHDILELKKMGVDGIFTNHPQHARNVLNGLTTDQRELLFYR